MFGTGKEFLILQYITGKDSMCVCRIVNLTSDLRLVFRFKNSIVESRKNDSCVPQETGYLCSPLTGTKGKREEELWAMKRSDTDED